MWCLTTCHHVPLSALLAVDHVHCEHWPSYITTVPVSLRPYVHCVDTNPCECISRVVPRPVPAVSRKEITMVGARIRGLVQPLG